MAPPDAPPPISAEARRLFESTVYPALVTQCAGCHTDGAASNGSPLTVDFVGTSLDTAYDRIMRDPVQMLMFCEGVGNARVCTFDPVRARLVAKVAEGHYGPYDGSVLGAIERWFTREQRRLDEP